MKIKIEKDLKDWIKMWSMAKKLSFEDTLNVLLREKMDDDRKKYLKELDEFFNKTETE